MDASSRPTDIEGMAEVVALATGNEHTCAMTAEGETLCWGRNQHGALGDGTDIDRATPAPIAAAADSIAIAAGFYFNCRIARGGQVWCWGHDEHGQLGLGSTATGAEALVPARALELGDATAITAGDDHACALRSSGEVTCWGLNDRDQLGDGTNDTERDYAGPTVIGLGSVAALSAGAQHTCALEITGEVRCWGAGTWGQLGDGADMNRATPGPSAAGLTGVVSLTTGDFHTCAVDGAGEAYCWGWNGEGQLGIGSVSAEQVVPQRVALP
jgi:alpha-tubulin suppressor-like RCC1 family protein